MLHSESPSLVIDHRASLLTGDKTHTELSVRPELNRQLVPSHCEGELASRGIVLDTFVPIPLEQLRISLD